MEGIPQSSGVVLLGRRLAEPEAPVESGGTPRASRKSQPGRCLQIHTNVSQQSAAELLALRRLTNVVRCLTRQRHCAARRILRVVLIFNLLIGDADAHVRRYRGAAANAVARDI